MTTIQIRVDENTKAAADALFASLGLDTSTAVRMFLAAALSHRGIPFAVRIPHEVVEINDGFGSYVCEHGYVHDYSKLLPKLREAAKETVGPFNFIEEMMKSLNDD